MSSESYYRNVILNSKPSREMLNLIVLSFAEEVKDEYPLLPDDPITLWREVYNQQCIHVNKKNKRCRLRANTLCPSTGERMCKFHSNLVETECD